MIFYLIDISIVWSSNGFIPQGKKLFQNRKVELSMGETVLPLPYSWGKIGVIGWAYSRLAFNFSKGKKLLLSRQGERGLNVRGKAGNTIQSLRQDTEKIDSDFKHSQMAVYFFKGGMDFILEGQKFFNTERQRVEFLVRVMMLSYLCSSMELINLYHIWIAFKVLRRKSWFILEGKKMLGYQKRDVKMAGKSGNTIQFMSQNGCC